MLVKKGKLSEGETKKRVGGWQREGRGGEEWWLEGNWVCCGFRRSMQHGDYSDQPGPQPMVDNQII